MRSSFERKEAELAALFASLDPTSPAMLSKRLLAPVDPGAAALAFAQMIDERRTRLLAILTRIARAR